MSELTTTEGPVSEPPPLFVTTHVEFEVEKEGQDNLELPSTTWAYKYNWLIHKLYVNHQIPSCLELIQKVLAKSNGYATFALYIQGNVGSVGNSTHFKLLKSVNIQALIKRQQGDLQASLEIFQQATLLEPNNPSYLKQVARGFFLLAKYKMAIQVYEEAEKYAGSDWEILHNKGICCTCTGEFEKALEYFLAALQLHRHDSTYSHLAKLYLMMDDITSAIKVYQEAIELSPQNVEFLVAVGLLNLQISNYRKAFDFLGRCLTFDPKNTKALLAFGAILQENGGFDAALSKYRIAAVINPNGAFLWNNIGMCFFGKKKFIAAISCLKRAYYLSPFEWKIAFNLGIAHLHTEQHVSAFHYLKASINLNPLHGRTFLWLGVTLVQLYDYENATMAFEKANSLCENDFLCIINYAVTLAKRQDMENCKMWLQKYQELSETIKLTEEQDIITSPEFQQAERMALLLEDKVATFATSILKPRKSIC